MEDDAEPPTTPGRKYLDSSRSCVDFGKMGAAGAMIIFGKVCQSLQLGFFLQIHLAGMTGHFFYLDLAIDLAKFQKTAFDSLPNFFLLDLLIHTRYILFIYCFYSP
jgi:hypothetical protein